MAALEVGQASEVVQVTAGTTTGTTMGAMDMATATPCTVMPRHTSPATVTTTVITTAPATTLRTATEWWGRVRRCCN